MRIKKIIARFLLKKIGWSIKGEMPTTKQNVVIGAPHTSMEDFKYAVLAAIYLDLKVKILIKKELFWFPLGFILRLFGGIPVDRSSKTNTVERIAELILSFAKFSLVMSPEGTRQKVTKWKSGFYYIALKAKVPIIVIKLDYGSRIIEICKTIYPTGDYILDMREIQSYFKDTVGKYPAKFQSFDSN